MSETEGSDVQSPGRGIYRRRAEARSLVMDFGDTVSMSRISSSRESVVIVMIYPSVILEPHGELVI